MPTKRKTRIYLCGRMDPDDPTDEQWRLDIAPFLEELGFEILNPYLLEPMQLKGLRPNRLPEGVKHWHELKDSKDARLYNRFKTYMRRIVAFDVNLVKKHADVVLVRWSEGCKGGAGTHAEVTIAFMCNKPVYCLAEVPLPAWIEACCDEVFHSVDEFKKFAQEEFGAQDGDDKLNKELIN